jgi:polysaccharide biosynthesis/export protein
VRGIALLLWIAGLAISAPAVNAQGDGGAYRIGPKDLVEIKVFEEPQLNGERRVDEDGNVTLPLIGDVAAAGLTEAEFAARLTSVLSKYMQRASVEIHVREFRSRPISLIGAVKEPGPLPYSGRWTLLEALTAAGGMAEGHGDVIYVLRRAENGLTDQVTVSVSDLMVKADPDANLPLFANDLVNVPPAEKVVVYCLGEFAQAGALTFDGGERVTLLAAIAHAGGLSDRAARMIQINRKGADGRSEELQVDYKRVLAGKDPDIELRAGDVLVAKESFF